MTVHFDPRAQARKELRAMRQLAIQPARSRLSNYLESAMWGALAGIPTGLVIGLLLVA